MKKKYFMMCCVLLGTLIQPKAEIILPKILSSNMVLQRDRNIPIWGKASHGEKITVTFTGQSMTTFADNTGRWSVELKPIAACSKPAEMIISGTNTVKLENILVGDVWLCSGQSNMEYPLDRSLKKFAVPTKGVDAEVEELSKSKPDQIRYILVEKQKVKGDLNSIGWITAANDSVLRRITAVGYFFAKDLYMELNVPVGIISTTWGGTRIEEWTPPSAYLTSPVFKDSLIGKKNFAIDGMVPGQKFDRMFSPIVPFAVKGMLWYQGESNCMIEDQQTYPEKMRLLVETYRSLLKNSDMPFYYVQIAPYVYSHRNQDKIQHSAEQLAAFREAQTQCLSIPNTGMIVTTDLVNNASNIHPPYKWIVGHRLALLALNKTYGKKVICSGPTLKSLRVKQNRAILSFENVGGGLISKDSLPLSWFSIAGANGNFVSATAEIVGNTVVVSSDEVKLPTAVRFGWDESAIPNLFNKEGLPARPFKIYK